MLLVYASNRLPTHSIIVLPILCVGGLILLIGSLKSVGNQKDRLGAVAGLLALAWVGIDLYRLRAAGFIQPGSIVNAFACAQHVVGGAAIVVLIRMVSPNSTKILLRIACIGFIVANLLALALIHDYPRPGLSGIFCNPVDAAFIGMFIPSAIFYGLDKHRKDKRVGGPPESP